VSGPPLLDAHQHFWDLALGRHPWLREEPPAPFRYGDTRPLRRTYLPADYRRDAARWRIAGTVHVEAGWDPDDPAGETAWVHDLAARHGLPSAVVAHARLDGEGVADVLARQAAWPLVRGIRDKPRVAPSPGAIEPGAPGAMSDPRWRAGFALLARHGLSFDLQAPWWHLPEAAALARAFPDTLIVLNHTGLPADRAPAGLAGWRRAMEGLAGCPNVAVKISGLGVPGRAWTVAANRRVILETIELFGPDRCMLASNFPVDSLVATLDTIYAGFETITASFSAGDRARLFHDTAARLYRIGG
jgi:predicted TIM-barrel fold metal-dependent hydrolase